MKKMRKGFTLVELIIVMAIVAILGTTIGMQLIGSTGSAKATAIVSNLDTVKGQARVYYAKYWNNKKKVDADQSDATTAKMLEEAMPSFTKYFDKDNDVITYEADGQGAINWAIKVDFSKDAESKDIADVLGEMKLYKDAYNPDGYKGYKVIGAEKGGKFKVFLLTGEVSVDKGNWD